jgi:hypothetical protein
LSENRFALFGTRSSLILRSASNQGIAEMQDQTRYVADDRAAGMLLFLASVLSVLAMAHHPTGLAQPGLVRLVHGGMMVLMLAMFAGFVRFAARRGLARLAVLCALVAYGAGIIGNLLAASVSGFLAPALSDADASPELLRLMWPLNQTFAFAAAYAISGAFALWGADLALRGGGVDRLLGLAGLAAGLAPAALLANGALDLHVAGAFVVYAAQAAFTALVGLWLARRS